MSKRRRSGQPTPNPEPEPFAVRWHSIADPDTPSVDIMSSPDPLNDETATFLAPPSSQRMTRSHRSTRFASLGRSVSPRKQQFELEVGDNRTPQRLLVTVETEDEDAPGTGTRRRLFPSSSPFKGGPRMTATTTTVPLKDSIEDEFGDGGVTPKKRGRPRKTNGTPLPSAAKKRRAPTPLKGTPKRPNTGRYAVSSSLEPSQPTPTPKRRGRPPKNSVEPPSDTGSQLEPMSDTSHQPTPTPKRRGRPPKNRSVEPSSDTGIGSHKKTPAAKGRRRRQALAPQDLQVMVEEPEPFAEQYGGDAMDTFGANPDEGNNEEAWASTTMREPNSDIWMTTGSNQATPRATARKSRSASAASPTPARAASVEAPPSDDMESVASQAEAFGEGAPSVSDAGSIMNAPYHSATRNDTVAQEDFSMIFMDSIQSYQDLRSSKQGPVPAQGELEDEGNHIITDTLESLRQGAEFVEEVAGADGQIIGHPTEEVAEEVAEVFVGDDRDTGMDDMDLVEAYEGPVDNIAEELAESEIDNPAMDEELGDAAYGDGYMAEELPAVPEERATTEPEAVEGEDFDYKDDVDMAQPGMTEGSEKSTDEPREEHAVPELHQAAASSSSPPPVEEPDEPEAVRISSPVRSAGLSSKFGASPWMSRTPRRPMVSPLRRQVLESVTKDDKTPRASHGYVNSPLAGPSRIAASPMITQDDSNLYEDSFSEIPEAILTAATPGRTAPLMVTESHHEDEDAEAEMLDNEAEHEDFGEEVVQDTGHEAPEPEQEEQQQQQPPFGYALADQEQPPAPSNASSVALTDNGRLPTPDDTPPEIDLEDDQPDKSTQASVASPIPEPQAQLVVEHTAAPSNSQWLNTLQKSVERGSSVPEITPANQASSPPQEPRSSASQSNPDKIPRPALSAIVRAGKVLQSVTSDPPSPGDRQNQLRSPFRSSVSRESREPASQRPSASPSRRSLSHQRQSASIDRLEDNPFAPKPRIPIGQGTFMQALDRSINGAAHNGQALNAGYAAGSIRFTPQLDEPQHDEMSWLPDAGPVDPSPPRQPSVHDEVAQSSPRQLENEGRSNADIQDEPAGHDDETDIWEVEAEREDPESSRKETSFLSMTSAPLHRRPAIPSPWTRKSELIQQEANAAQFGGSIMSNVASRLDEQDDDGEGYSLLAQSQKQKAQNAQDQQDDDGEGYSLLAQRQKAKEAEAAKGPGSSAKASRFDLSSFFSSPAAIGGALAEKFFPSKPREEPEMQEAPIMPHSTMFPSVPQKQFEPSSDGRTDLFSPTRSREPQQSSSPSQRTRSHTQSVRAASQQAEAPAEYSAVDPSASPETPEHLQRPVSVQKNDFTPRPRQASQSFHQPSTNRSAAMTPPRMQLSHNDIERWQQQTSTASEDEPDSPRALLRPLPPRDASPSKSAIRSPLKPHTPGRVVEFTSSVLSPIEQAKQRQLRQASFLQYEYENEEDEHVDVSMADAPVTKSEPKNLSRDIWSREHWLFLDKLLQHRKTQRFGIECQPRSARFLGKTVRSNGESLKLDQWHLDCVDAFKAVVGGWDEGALCKRLFSLLKAEEKRIGGFADGSEEMFH